MALISREIYAGVRRNALTGNGVVGERRFQVIGTENEVVDPALVINNTTITPILPQRNDEFDFNGYVLQVVGYSCSPTIAPNVVEVVITYDDFLLARREEHASVLFTERYPTYVQEPYVTVTGGNTQSPVLANRWVPRVVEIENSPGQIIVTVPVFRWGTVERKKVAKQIGKMHDIKQLVAKFIGASVSYITFDRWEVTYRWAVDPGFKGSELDFGSGGIIIRPAKPPRGDPTGPPNFDRGPFEKYFRVPSSQIGTSGLADPPRIIMLPAPEPVPIEQVDLPRAPGVILFP